MAYDLIVEEINSDIEEEVTVIVEGVKIVCFASFCPYPIEIGGVYPAVLKMVVLNEYSVSEAEGLGKSLNRIGKGFSYILNGVLSDDGIDVGFTIQDDFIQKEYYYLKGRLVSVAVDRIDVEFLERHK